MINEKSAEMATNVIIKSIQMLNERNTKGLLSTFHAPHIIIGESETLIYHTAEELQSKYWQDFYRRAGQDWDHTVIDWTEAIYATETKAHIFMQFSRYSKDDTLLTREKALWVINKQNDVWAAQGRSNFGCSKGQEIFSINKTTAQIAINIITENINKLNEGNQQGLLDLFHIPHIRISESDMLVYNSREELENEYLSDFYNRAGNDWHHTVLDWTEPIHASDNKAHIFIQWSRYTETNDLITSQRSLWIVNDRNGRWGVQARSSFAPN